MITWIRSAAIASGQAPAAFAFVKKAAAHVEERHGIKIMIGRPLAGNPTRIFWYAQHEDLQAYERDHTKINTDGEFLRMLGEHSHCFISGTTHDEVLQAI